MMVSISPGHHTGHPTERLTVTMLGCAVMNRGDESSLSSLGAGIRESTLEGLDSGHREWGGMVHVCACHLPPLHSHAGCSKLGEKRWSQVWLRVVGTGRCMGGGRNGGTG